MREIIENGLIDLKSQIEVASATLNRLLGAESAFKILLVEFEKCELEKNIKPNKKSLQKNN